MSDDRDTPKFAIMLILPMAPLCHDQLPTVILDETNDIADLHAFKAVITDSSRFIVSGVARVKGRRTTF